jgi:hypothetical protein
VFGLGLAGCPSSTNPPSTSEATLVLQLPSSTQPPQHASDRVPKLTINGKDEPVKWGDAKELTVKVPPPESKDDITIVYSFWPKSYSNTIRTKVAKFEKGARIKVDFNIEDEGRPDSIKPIYFPTPESVVDEMCRMAQVGKDDVVCDIGCGDGRLVIGGVKRFGAKRGIGVEINPELIVACKENAVKAGVSDKVEFRNEDALKMKDLPEATVVLLYVGEDFGKVLGPVLRKTLKPGARVVSHRFPLGDWEPDVEKTITAKNNYEQDEEYILKLWTIK